MQKAKKNGTQEIELRLRLLLRTGTRRHEIRASIAHPNRIKRKLRK